MTQCDRVKQYMEDFGTISQLQAIHDLGVMRLASRISDLRKDGVCIGKRTEATRNRYGDLVHYAVYYLEDKQ